MMIFETIKYILKSKDEHYLSVSYDIFKRWKYIILMMVLFNRRYKKCVIYRKKFKEHENFVVIALKYTGKKIKRRTNGFAKRFIQEHPDAKCLYCDIKLTEENSNTDHIIPISHGGNNSQVNLVVCCIECNFERGNIEFYKFRKNKNSKKDKFF
jgi:5-methylcytosine-specific restriction endonuclease McrA